jgi:CheY-like chemotaxis protein
MSATAQTPMIVQRRSVLVADDEEVIRFLVARVITQLGLAALCVGDGAAAIQTAATHRAELVCAVLDIRMPIMDGADAAHAIQHMAPEVPIVLMSGAVPAHCTDRIKQLRLAGMLHKPFALTALRGLILQAVDDSYTLGAAYKTQGEAS